MNSQRDTVGLELELPAAPASVTRARHQVAELPLRSALVRENVILAVSEAVGNAVLHAYDEDEEGTVAISARIEGNRLTVTVADTGRGVRPNLHRKGLGMGLGIMRHVASDMKLESSQSGTTVTLVFEDAI